MKVRPFGTALRSLCFLAALFLCVPAAFAAPAIVTLKIASGAPENSPIGQALERMSAEWFRLSGGRVAVKVYHGGALGDASALKQKMATGLLDGALFTSVGMAAFVPDFMSLSAPFMVKDEAEFDYVFKTLRPELESEIAGQGYVSLALTPAGWVRFFTRSPVRSPDDLRKLKLGVSSSDEALFQILKEQRMNVTLVSSSSMLQMLQARSLDAIYMNAVYFSYQWSSFSQTVPWMTDMPLSPFLGCLLVKASSWQKVPADLKPSLLASSKAIGDRMGQELQDKELSTIRELQGYGLKVAKPSAAEVASWADTFSAGLAAERGEAFPKAMLAKVERALAEYRALRK